ncbi:glycosyltransferase family 2 protein [Candidatus Pacearchaeota archaeon]|nr:glycosyltransferase family 2 protein [Candidatus Pacearchaeota archaeon]
MPENPELSVVVPIYGQFDLERAKISIQSMLSQQDVSHEVIVSEQGENPRFSKIKGIKHIFEYHKPKSDLSDFNPGNVRNKAISQATGEFVYTNDADIVFLQQDYLARCVDEMKESPKSVFYRPFMRRLPIGEFSQFKTLVQKFGITEALQFLNLEQKYLATLSRRVRKMRVFEKDSVYHKIFTAFEEDFQRYVSDEGNK